MWKNSGHPLRSPAYVFVLTIKIFFPPMTVNFVKTLYIANCLFIMRLRDESLVCDKAKRGIPAHWNAHLNYT